MSIVIDILFLIIIGCAVYSGINKGFVRSVMNFMTFWISLICGWQMTPYLTEYYKKSIFLSKLTASVGDAINALIGSGVDSIGLDTLINEKPEAFTQMLYRFNMEISQVDEFYKKQIADGVDNVIDTLSNYIAEPIADSISAILAFITIFIGVFIILKIITLILDAIFKLPVLNFINRFFGCLLGISCGMLYAWIFSMIFTALAPVLPALFPDTFSPSMINNSILLSYFNKYNLLAIMGNKLNIY